MNFKNAPKTKLVKFLIKNGFIGLVDRRNGDHRYHFNEATKRLTQVDWGKKTIPTGTLLAIIKQSGIPKDDWRKY